MVPRYLFDLLANEKDEGTMVNGHQDWVKILLKELGVPSNLCISASFEITPWDMAHLDLRLTVPREVMVRTSHKYALMDEKVKESIFEALDNLKIKYDSENDGHNSRD